MPLRDDLLNPIPGPSPSGEYLRGKPIYDEIAQARKEEQEVGRKDRPDMWALPVKKADWPRVVKLAGEVLATQSKDLQVAAWLTEGLLRLDGYPGLTAGLGLMRGLVEQFWETLYPEIEEGDLEFRATPLEWVGSRLEEAVKRVTLTASGLDWFVYRKARDIGTEEEAAADALKREAREEAIKAKILTSEDFDAAVLATPDKLLQERTAQLEESLAALDALDRLCEDKFGRDLAPSLTPLKKTLEEVKQTVRMLAAKKRPKAEEAAEEAAEAPAAEGYVEEAPAEEPEAAPARRPARKKALGAEPADAEEAFEHVRVATRFLRQQDAYSPVPYLLLRGWRWGELRAAGPEPDPSLLEPPATEVRQQLRSLARDGYWQEVLEACETAMSEPCGRAWLDLQRYAVKACEELGSYYDPVAAAIRGELRALLADVPRLPEWTLSDDTPTANAETQTWLRQIGQPPERGALLSAAQDEEPQEVAEDGSLVRDAFEVALEAARSGRAPEAIEILTREAAQERSGRARFQRKVQLAQICLGAGLETLAGPVLEDLAAEIERRRLEEWEAPETLAHALALLYRSLGKLGASAEERQKVYARICRLDPVQALACAR